MHKKVVKRDHLKWQLSIYFGNEKWWKLFVVLFESIYSNNNINIHSLSRLYEVLNFWYINIGTSDRLFSCAKDLKIKIWALVFEEVDTRLFTLICMRAVSLTLNLTLKNYCNSSLIELQINLNQATSIKYFEPGDQPSR